MFLKLRYYSRLLLAFLSRFKLIIFLSIILGFAVFFFAQLIGNSTLTKSKEKIGIVGRYETDNLPHDILELISDGLTMHTADGNVEPNLADVWETPDKGKTWIFKLKDDIYWQDGEEIKSSDLSYSFSDVEIEYTDDKTIVFKLQDPFSPFPSVVSRPTFKKGLLGTDKWKVDNITTSREFVQELTIVDEDKNKIVHKFYPTEEAAKLALKLGEVDEIRNIYDQKPFDEWANLTVKENIEENSVVTIFFNTNDKLLSAKSARQGLMYAIDKNVLSNNRAISSINPNSWAYNPQVKKYTFDKERAQELFEDIPDEILSEPVKLVTAPPLLSTAEEIAKYWREAGIETTVQVSSIVPTEYQAFLTILHIPKDPDQYAYWHSTQTQTNISSYKNPRIDKLLEDGRTELQTEDRKKIYLDFQRFLLEDLPAAFLYHPVIYSIKRI